MSAGVTEGTRGSQEPWREAVPAVGRLSRDRRRSVAVGAVCSATDLLVGAACSLGTTAVLARRVGIAVYGSVAVALSALAVVAAVDVGLAFSVQRAAARAGTASSAADDRAVLQTSTALYGAAGLVVLVVGVVGASIAPHLVAHPVDGLAPTLVLLAVNAAALTATAPWPAVASGRGRFVLVAATSAVPAVAALAALTGTVAAHGLVSLGWATLGATVVGRTALLAGDGEVRRVVRGVRLPSRALLRVVRRDATPLLVIGVGGQLVAFGDLLIVGVVASAAAAGVYRVSLALPVLVAGLIYRACDVGFPSLVRREMSADVLSAACAATAGAVFTALAVRAHDAVTLVLGRDLPTAAPVLVLFAATAAANAVVHVPSLELIARGRHDRLTVLVGAEFAVNIALSVVLAVTVGVTGPAVATLVVAGLSNLVLFPVVVATAVPGTWRAHRRALGALAFGSGAGAGAALLGGLAPTAQLRALVTAAAVLVCAAVVVAAARRRR